MAFWLGILAGGIFAWFAVKLRFYQTWALTFHIIISIYLAIYLRPAIVNNPAIGDTPYSSVLTLLVIAAASFLILHSVSYVFLTGQFDIRLHKIFDTLGAGILGFLAGFLIWTFLSLLIYITPAYQNSLIQDIGFTSGFQQTSVSYISRFCDLVNAVVSSQDNKYSAEHTINQLLKDAARKNRPERIKLEEKPEAEPNEPEPTIEEKLGAPPEIDI